MRLDSDVNRRVCISTGAGEYSSRKKSKFFIDLLPPIWCRPFPLASGKIIYGFPKNAPFAIRTGFTLTDIVGIQQEGRADS